jgi:fructose-specific phosphotransferase system IIA component
MKICDILKQDKIITELKGESKEEVINELLDLFDNDNRVIDISKVKKAVIEREKIMTTAIGKLIAIPHAKSNAVKEMIAAFGKFVQPFDFDSLDNKPVYLVFLFVSTTNLATDHLKLLSRISRMMDNDEFRKNLLTASSAEEIYELFHEEENRILDLIAR